MARALTSKNLAAGYPDNIVWRDASFAIDRGEFVAVIGPNGAGKTTLFRLLLGLQQPISGTIKIFNAAPKRGNPQIGYVPQRHIFDGETNAESLELVRLGFSGKRWGLGLFSQNDRKAALETLEAVGASDLAHRSLGMLSGGELQRIFLAEALVSNPSILLLDEPLSNLDMRREKELLQLINNVVRSRNVTALLIAHNINPLLPFLDKVVHIANGNVATGTPQEVLTSECLTALFGVHVEVLRDSRGNVAVVGIEDATVMTKMTININPWVNLLQIFQYQFMQHAFEAGTVVAIIAGIVGYFVVLRRSSFAAHALSHIGFSGAAGAVLFGISPVFGLLLFTTVGGLGIAALGRRAAQRDVQIGTVLAFMLGIGVLFISLYTGYATEAYSILFGEILGISFSDVLLTFVAGLIILALVAAVYRPLLFASLDEDVAEAKGMPVLLLGIIFMILVAVATSIAVQVVGVLLIFSLMVTPAATAQQLAKRPQQVIIISVAIALIATWSGLFVSFYEPYPVSFFITSFVFVFYLFVRFIYRRIRPQKPFPSDFQGISTIKAAAEFPPAQGQETSSQFDSHCGSETFV